MLNLPGLSEIDNLRRRTS